MTMVIYLSMSIFGLSCNKNREVITEPGKNDEVLCDSILSVDIKELNFGEIDKNNTPIIPFEFSIRNIGDCYVKIDKVDVSCSCVSVNDYPKQLIPGQTGILSGKVDLKNQKGHMRKSIFISYCDTCVVALKITSDIID